MASPQIELLPAASPRPSNGQASTLISVLASSRPPLLLLFIGFTPGVSFPTDPMPQGVKAGLGHSSGEPPLIVPFGRPPSSEHSIMSVSGISLALGITEYELFVRAHRSFGPADRTTLDRDFRRYEISGSEPDYVRGFCIAHEAEVLSSKAASDSAPNCSAT